MPTTTIYANTNTTGRGYISTSSTDWDDAVTSATGTVSSTSSSTLMVRAGVLSGRGSATYFVSRAFVFFDLSSITTTITAATVKVVSNGTNGGDVGMYGSTAFGNNGTSLASSDFEKVTGNLQSGTIYTDLTWGNGSLRSFPLNATAITALNSNGYGNYSFRNTKDVDEEEPEEDSYAGINFLTSGTNRIQIEVTHAAAGYSNTVNSVTAANYDKINSISKSSIERINLTPIPPP